MRFKIKPPTKAPNSASSQAPNGAGVGWLRLALSAASSAGDTAATGATAGQLPCTGNSMRQACARWLASASASTTGNCVGLSLRSADSGTCAVHTPPCQPCVITPAGSVTPVVSGKNSSALPCRLEGRPVTDTRNSLSSGVACPLPPVSAWGLVLRAASKAAPCAA